MSSSTTLKRHNTQCYTFRFTGWTINRHLFSQKLKKKRYILARNCVLLVRSQQIWLFIKTISIRPNCKLKYPNYEVNRNKNRNSLNSSRSKRTGWFKLRQFLPVQFMWTEICITVWCDVTVLCRTTYCPLFMIRKMQNGKHQNKTVVCNVFFSKIHSPQICSILCHYSHL
jgi:hypothetical protein